MHKPQFLPQKYIEEFSTIYHLTSVPAAIKIIETGLITSNDAIRHANFSVITTKHNLAKSCEVCLIFTWPYEHALYLGDPFGCFPEFSPEFTSLPLLHIFLEEDYKDDENLLSKSYWQSNLYPGSEGLIFEGIEVYIDYSPIPKWWQFFSYNYQQRKKFAIQRNQTIDQLNQIAKSEKGSILKVPNITHKSI